MFEQDPQFFRHSMTTAHHRATRNGASRSMWIIICSIFGILCILHFPVVDGAFTCPSNCTCETFKVSGVKYQNITCAGKGLTEVPSDGKEGADVVKLILSNNQISSINQSSFQYFSSLVELDLSSNQITSIDEDVFSNLTSLQILNLAANTDLASLPSGLFDDTPMLTLNLSQNINFDLQTLKDFDDDLYSLDISHMSLTQFPKSALKRIDGLLEVDVSFNNITELPKNCLKRNSLVQKLDVSHNFISTVHSDAFKDDDGLTNLNLSHNFITSLDSKFFDDVDVLEILDISYNRLTTLDTELFEDTPLITNLYLDNNQLSSLPSDIFQYFTSISNIDLSRNNFSFLSSSIFSSISGYSLDVSNNPFACDCDFRNFLYGLEYQNNLANKASVKCIESSTSHTYLDWDDALCSGNLGSSCSSYQECMAQHSTCSGGTCTCKQFYYDNNGLSSPAGLCKPQVALDYPCDTDDACETSYSECTGSGTKRCLCLHGYYDDNPNILGGLCHLKLNLGGACTFDSMCNTTNAYCGSNGKCICQSAYYDDNTDSTDGGECLPKIPLNSACNYSEQCATANSECSGNVCSCTTGFYEIENSGLCQGPESFYSCYPYNTSSTDINFAFSASKSSMEDCEEYCFNQTARYYVLVSNICLCGNVNVNESCCPKVMDTCNSREYIGPTVGYVKSGMNVTAIPQLYVGQANTFSVTTTLSIVDQIRWLFGASQSEVIVNSSSSSYSFTYTYSGKFDLTIKACIRASSVCDIVTLPVRVQVPRQNMTTYITGRTPASISGGIADFYATFKQGYDFEYFWQIEDSSSVKTWRKGCTNGWTAHRSKCLKLSASSASFSTAKANCVSQNATLLEISHLEEIAEIVTALGASSIELLTGAEKVGGLWQWSSNGAKTVFSDNHLTSSTSGNCAIIDGPSQSLTSISCSASTKYACMIDPVDCPYGGELLGNNHCVVLASTVSASNMAWSNAQSYCETNFNGWLANITSAQVHSILSSILNSSSISEAYFGLSDQILEGYLLWADDTSFTGEYNPTKEASTGNCYITKKNNTWAKAGCSASKDFFCEYSQNIERLTVPSYLVGTPDVKISPGSNLQQVVPFDTFTDLSISTEIILFPGLWITKTGSIRYWIVHTVHIGSGESFDGAFQIYRPTCSSGTLVQPGCFSTKYATCSMTSPTCAQNTCSTSQHFCYLSNTCKFFNESCTCNSESGSTTSCSSSGTPPTYTVHAQTDVTVAITGENVVVIPAGDLSVQEHDIIGFQFPYGQNFIKSETVSSGHDQQSTYKVNHTGWLSKGDTFPISTKVDEEKTYYFHAIYTETQTKNLSQSQAYAKVVGEYDLSITIIDTDVKELDVTLEEAIDDIEVIYPTIQENSSELDNLGTIYTEYNQAYDVTVRVGIGNNKRYSFDSSPPVTFQSYCSPTVQNTISIQDLCNASLVWADKPFAYVSYNTTSTGTSVKTLKVSNSLGTTTKYLTIRTEKKIEGVNVTLQTTALIENNVAVNRESTFLTTYSSGTEISFSYKVNDVNISSTSSQMKYTFTSIGTFTVSAFVTNILGVESANVTIYVKQPAEFSSCIYVGTPYIAVINVPIAIVVECTVNVNAEVSAQFDFGDSTAYTLATATTTSTKKTWTYSKTFTNTALDVQVNATIKDPFEAVTVSTTVDVYNQIPSVSLSLSETEILLGNNTSLTLTIPSTPGNYGNVIFSADFGDSTNATNTSGLFTHTYGTAGSYMINVTASNGPSLVSTNQTVTVYSVVGGLSAYYDGPTKKGDTTVITASNTDGNFVSYRFYSLEFNVTQTSGTFSFIFATAGTHTVDIICSNALSSKKISLVVYVLDATDIIIENLRMNGVNISGCIESGISNTYGVSLIHYDVSNLHYNWDFGDNTTINTTTTNRSHSYAHSGNYTLNVTVFYSSESARKSISAEICIEDKIESPSLNVTNQIGLPSTGILNLTLLVTLVKGSSVSYLWTSNATVLSSLSAAMLTVQITGHGFYTFSVSVWNSLSNETVAKTVEVIEEVSSVTITCASCTEESGNLYTETSQNAVYNIQTITGTSLSYTWNMGDGTTSTGSSVTHAYSSIGSYTITVSVSNAVHRVNQTKIVYVESALTSVTIQTYLYDWKNNKVSPTIKDLDISQTARLTASVLPTRMSPLYHWRFDTGLSPVTTSSNIGEYNFTTTGLKSCTVVVSNKINNVTATAFNFYIIEELTSLTVTEGNTVLTNSTHLVALNHVINISVASSQIVDGSVTYHVILKDPNNRLTGSSTSSSLTGTLSSTGTYTVTVQVENSINAIDEQFHVEVIQAASGPYISADSGVDGNITLGSSIDLYGGSSTGKYLTFSWSYLSAPPGQSFSSSDQNVTLTPNQVGQYDVRLTVTNPVSSDLNVEFTIKVMQAVTGVSISSSLSPPDAVKVGSTVMFQATVTTGSDLSYSWIAVGGINPANGDTANFTLTFGLQAYYNITLSVSNYASSGSDVKQIYALNEVPAFNILVNSGATYNNNIGKYVVVSGQNVTYSSDIASAEFIEFDWKINSTSNGTNKDFYNIFNTVGSYIVSLTASNKISSEANEITMLIQNAISNFVLTGCNATYLLNSSISLSSTFSSGTDVTVEWKHSSISTGASTVVSYSTVGEHQINVTASNYVSTVFSNCIITIQGIISNLNITVSEYKFVGHAISFNVTGDYFSSATFLWKFSHGITNTTTTASLEHIFSARGSYNLTVNVSNVVSWSEVSVSFTVEDLKCSPPSIDGSSERTTVRARSVELAVTVSTSGCTDYTSVNRWIVYEATSCTASLTTTYSLSSSVAVNTPILQLPAATLPYNAYCIVFEITYSNTPVVKYAYFNITIGESPLMALISGGDSRAASAGTTLILDGTTSHDPDSSGATLVYAWSCSQNMGTTSAINVCNEINAVTTPNATITGIALTKNDVYNVTLTVSATGRTSGQTSQKITITDAGAPVVAMECVSCAANENYYISTSKKTCLKGICYSGCNSSTTYLWTVTDTSTDTDLSIGTSQTTTGTNSINFCLSAGTLQDAKAYKFKLEATTGTATGFAEQSHKASTVPQSGSCSLSSTGNRIVPLSDQITVTCQNWSDQDSMSGLYYKIVASYGNDSYIVNYGTQSSTDFFLSSWPGTNYADVTVTISVINDHGIEVTALTENVQFKAPNLSLSQTDNVSYLVDQVVGTMPTIAKQNNPNLLVRYSIAALMFLNDQSKNNINTTAVRMAIRDLFAYSLDGVPYSSVNDIRQIGSAVKYLSEYPDELSKTTLSKVDTAISTLSNTLDSNVRQGHDQNDFKTDSLLEAITNVHSSLQSITSTTRDSATWTKFGNIDNYSLDISNRSSTTSFTSDSAMQRELTKKSIEYRTQLAIVQLKTLLPDEEAINKTLTDGSAIIAQHVSVSNIRQELSQTGVALFIPTDILDYTTYTQDSVYHITVFDNQNPFNFGYDTEVAINTKTLQTGFHDLSGNGISVSSLPSSKEVVLYMFRTDVPTYSVPASGIMNATGYNPREGVTNKSCTDLILGKNQYMTVAQPADTSASIHIQILPEFSSSQATGQLIATLFKNDVAYTTSASLESARPLNVTYGIFSDNKTDHTTYTFYIPVSERGSNAFKVQLTANLNVRVCVAIYFAKCSYFKTNSSTWASDGCTPQEESIPTVSKCQCNHMTSYGSGLLLSPDQIDFTDLSDLDIVNNPVAIITCSIILGMYIILVIICRKLDLLDIKHISSIPLCGKDGSFKYNVMVFTGRQFGAGTSAHVGIQLLGSYWKTAQKHIYKEGAFQRNCCDTFIIAHDVNLGEVKKIRIWHDNTGSSPSWYLDHVVVHDLQTDQQYYFYCQSWLTLETTTGTIHKKIPAAGSQDRNRFSRRFKTAMFNSLADKHLWLSLLNRPAQSRFTRVQRATCCVTLLFTFICVNAMWYGLLKKDNQDLGWESFSWEEIVLAIVTNVMVLPINLGLIFLFKKSRTKANLFETLQKPQTAQTIEIENYCENSQGGSFESQNTGEIPYDLDRESTIDSVPANARGLHRSRHVSRRMRENTDDSLDRGKRPSVSVTNSSGSPHWNEDSSMKWSEVSDSPASSSMARPSTKVQKSIGDKQTTGAYKKRKTIGKVESDELIAELDKMEKELRESESRPVRSASSGHSSTSARSRRLTVSELESLNDILHSDDESGTSNKAPKTKSKSGARFNPRADPRINGNGSTSRGSASSGLSQEPESSSSGVTAGLRPAYYSELTMESRDIRQIPVPKEKCSLPPWCIYIAYVLCFLLCVFSVVIVILYCFKFGADEALKWVLACLLSLVLSFCVVEPLKALMIAVYMVAMMKNVDKNDEDDCIEIDPTIDLSHENIQEQSFEPISGFALIKATEEGRKIRRMKTIIRQFFAYMFYLWVIMVIVYVHFHYNSYLFNKYVETSFINSTTMNFVGYNNISTIDEFWDWTENVFAETLHLQDSHTDEEHGFLLGAARMRLIRSLTEKCHASSAASSLGASVLTDRICYGDGGFEEDTGLYGERWNDSSYNKSWRYVYANELGGSDKLGFVATYSGGGYLQTLGTSYAETLTIIQDLKDKGWIDLRTRAVVFEFSFYSPGSDMTAVTAMLVEFPLTGGVITSYDILSQRLLWFQKNRVDPLMVMECILLLVVIYSCVHIALQIREKRAAYFKEFWHWYEMITTLATIVSIGMYMGCVIEATNTFNNFLNDQSGFTNFERVAHLHVGTRYLYAWLLFLIMYKVVRQLQFVKFLYVYGVTLKTAFGHILGAGLIYVILLLTYAQLGYLMYGRAVPGFESVGHAVSTLVVIIRGTFNFWPMLNHQPVFSHFYLYSYYGFAYGILVALVISILQSCYRINKSKMYYKDSLDMKDYEMIEFMINRFKLWAGIKKQKPAFRRVHFPGLPSVSSRASTSHSNRSSESTESTNTTFEPESYEPYLKRMAGRLGPTWQLFLRRFDEIEILDQEEQRLVKKTEALVKDLNLRCRINELERQGKEILSWHKSSSSKPPVSDSKLRQSQRIANRDNQEQKAPSTVTGATSRAAATPPGKEQKPAQSKRPFSDQGARAEQTSESKASVPEKNKLQKFLKSVKSSKPAWNNDS